MPLRQPFETPAIDDDEDEMQEMPASEDDEPMPDADLHNDDNDNHANDEGDSSMDNDGIEYFTGSRESSEPPTRITNSRGA